MEDCTRVVLYGTFDGSAFSTDNFLQISVILDSGEKVEIPTECVTSADRIVKKDEIKLKDVIKRIEKFDIGTKAVWINGILNELGSDYGTFKYKAGYEQGKFDGAVEREKVIVPQLVADWISFVKTNGLKFKNTYGFYEEIAPSDDVYRVMYYIFKESIADKELRKWVCDNIDTFARAWLDGYEVEKEKRYTVKLKNTNDYLNETEVGFHFYDNCRDNGKFTQKEIEEAGFGWVFDCPGIEVEEVEE